MVEGGFNLSDNFTGYPPPIMGSSSDSFPISFAASNASNVIETPSIGNPNSDPYQTVFVAEGEERMQDDIKTIYHPHSGLASKIQRFEGYSTDRCCEDVSIPAEPWRPFRSRLDFEVAELTLATYMNEEEINTLCSLIHCAASGFEKFTITGKCDLDSL